MKSIIVTLLLVCTAFAAVASTPKPFIIHDFIGSWIYTEKVVMTTTGEGVTDQVLKQYNITSTGIQGEYEIIPCNPYTGERIAMNYQLTMTTTDNYTATINKVSTEEENPITKLTSFTLDEYLPKEVYMAFGTLETEDCSYEISIVNHNYITYKCGNSETNQATVINAKRIYIEPPKTFWQKYGMQIIMGVFLLIQMVMRGYTMPDMDKAKVD